MAEFVPRSAQAPESDWMKEHKGAYIKTTSEVWYCEDEVCNCWQSRVADVYKNRVTGNTFCFKGVWEGGFYSGDSERSPSRMAENDLIRYRQQLKKDDPELEAQITWQNGVEYDRDLALEDDPSVW